MAIMGTLSFAVQKKESETIMSVCVCIWMRVADDMKSPTVLGNVLM